MPEHSQADHSALNKKLSSTLLHELGQQLQKSPLYARRLFHGRGKAFEGLAHLNIEWYPPYLFVQNFTATLSESETRVLEKLFANEPSIEAILVQAREWPDFVTTVLCSRQPVDLPVSHWTALNNEIMCETNLGKNRNTGLFLDMRAGWDWVQHNSTDCSVLNLFSYTGIFSLFALQGGAKKVDNVDMAANVLKIAQRNHQKNNLHDGKTAFYKRDILKSARWFEHREPYDLIIIDPPPYQKKAFRGWSDYQKLLKTCRDVLADNGRLFTCLNNPQVSVHEFITDLHKLFPDAIAMTHIERAPEIRELDNNKGLKTLVVQF
jgi:23S rRNA (cytosine1962-C5)-methyltransferase